jgi:hypothetical protein
MGRLVTYTKKLKKDLLRTQKNLKKDLLHFLYTKKLKKDSLRTQKKILKKTYYVHFFFYGPHIGEVDFFIFFYGSPTGEACGQGLGHDRWAPHHGSRVEEGELLLTNHVISFIPLLIVVCWCIYSFRFLPDDTCCRSSIYMNLWRHAFVIFHHRW